PPHTGSSALSLHDALPISAAAGEFAHDALGRTVGDGGVDEVPTGCDVVIEDAPGLVEVGAPTEVVTEGGGAEGQRRDAQPRATELTVGVESKGHIVLLRIRVDERGGPVEYGCPTQALSPWPPATVIS